MRSILAHLVFIYIRVYFIIENRPTPSGDLFFSLFNEPLVVFVGDVLDDRRRCTGPLVLYFLTIGVRALLYR